MLTLAAGQAGLTLRDHHDLHPPVIAAVNDHAMEMNALAADFNRALAQGNAEGLATLMARLKGCGLNPQQITDVALCKNARGMPGLYLALYIGHAAAVTAFMQGLKGLGLNPQQIETIVRAKNARGNSGLFFALHGGHTAAVAAFMSGLKDLRLDAEHIANILVARGNYGLPGLYVALRSGNTAVMTAFMQSLNGFGLDPAQIAMILVAKAAGGIPGLHMALLTGQAATVTAFMNSLLNRIEDVREAVLQTPQLPKDLSRLATDYAIAAELDLSTEQIADIVAARNQEGMAGLAVAWQHEQTAAAQACIDGLTMLRSQGRITEGQFAGLVQEAPLPEVAGVNTAASRKPPCAIS